jgi:hypothetical protein
MLVEWVSRHRIAEGPQERAPVSSSRSHSPRPSPPLSLHEAHILSGKVKAGPFRSRRCPACRTCWVHMEPFEVPVSLEERFRAAPGLAGHPDRGAQVDGIGRPRFRSAARPLLARSSPPPPGLMSHVAHAGRESTESIPRARAGRQSRSRGRFGHTAFPFQLCKALDSAPDGHRNTRAREAALHLAHPTGIPGWCRPDSLNGHSRGRPGRNHPHGARSGRSGPAGLAGSRHGEGSWSVPRSCRFRA